MSLYLGWWAYPIYGEDGDYLKLMKDTLSDAGEWNQAWNLSDDEKNMLKDSSGGFLIKNENKVSRGPHILEMAHMIWAISHD